MVTKKRMTGADRREQLISVARATFAERGFDGTAIEEVAARAEVSKPVIYEHFGGKEGLYAVVVDREVQTLLTTLRRALAVPTDTPRIVLEQTALALLSYVDEHADGFRILVRDSPMDSASIQTILGDVASRVEGLLVEGFKQSDLDPATAPMYSQMLVGMVAHVGLWWLDTREPAREVVAAHVVNMAWNGVRGLDGSPPPIVAIPQA